MNQDSRGFTIVELMISMTFVAILMLIIASIVIQVMNTYTFGTTLREVNQVGRRISEDIQRAISDSPSFRVSDNFISDVTPKKISNGWRLCTGRYTYIGSRPTANNGQLDSAGQRIVFNRYNDAGSSLCRNINERPNPSDGVSMLGGGDRELVLHSLNVLSDSITDTASRQSVYTISFRIGTKSEDAIDYKGDCRPPSEAGGMENYCSINRFVVTVRSGGLL